MNLHTIRDVLSRSLSEPLSPADLAELASRLEAHDEQLSQLRELPLEGVDPAVVPELEEPA